MPKQPETIAQAIMAVWPGFAIHPDQTVGELQKWIVGEILQLTKALEILTDHSVVGPGDAAKLTERIFTPKS